MRRIINIILTLILIISVSNIGVKMYKYYDDRENNKQVHLLKPIEEINEESNILKNNENNSIENLKNINSDYKLWLTIGNTNIDYAVVQGNNNEFYLNKNFYKDDSISGNLFIDYRNNVDDENLIIYGHNMKNKTMFQNLNKFLNRDFFYENDNIEIIVDNKKLIYQIFSVYTTSNAEEYLVQKFSSEYEFNRYIDKVNKESLYKKEVVISSENKLITLVTCVNAVGDSRIIIHGSLLEDKVDEN